MSTTSNRVSTSAEVLIVGETIIDVIDRNGERSEHVGGSPANVALTLGRLGHQVRFATEIADDERGIRALEHLAASDVAVQSRPGGRTSTAVAHLQDDGSARYEFDVTWEPPVIDSGVATHVHTGSIAAFLQPGADAVRTLFESLPVGVTRSIDPNIRPALVGSHHEALTTFHTLASNSDVVKLSDEDANWLFPDSTVDDVLNGLLSLGARLAIVTLGSEGLVLASTEARTKVPARKVRVADTIGAGDAAMGAIIDAVVRDGLDQLDQVELLRIGKWAAHVAGVTTSRIGANPPKRHELAG